MTTKRITDFLELKKKYPNIYSELKEIFKKNHYTLKMYDLDYLVINKNTNEFYLSMSSGDTETFHSFYMNGEVLEDEISVSNYSFDSEDKDSDGEGEYNTYKVSYNEDDPDIDY